MNWYFAVLKNYAGFSGRARRKEYWMFFMFNVIFAVIAIILDNVLGTVFEGFGYGFIYILYGLVVFIPGLAVSVRRLHDVGKSGWNMLIVAIPLIGAIWLLVLMVLDSVPDENKYGPNPKEEIVSHNNIEPVMKMEEKFTKRIAFQIFTVIIGLGLILVVIKSFLVNEPRKNNLQSNQDTISIFSKNQMILVSELNKNCPIMVDSETRLDNAISLPFNTIQFNYTLVNWVKDSLNIDETYKGLEVDVVNRVKTSPDLQIFREKKVTMNFDLRDKEGVFLFRIVVAPEQYLVTGKEDPMRADSAFDIILEKSLKDFTSRNFKEEWNQKNFLSKLSFGIEEYWLNMKYGVQEFWSH